MKKIILKFVLLISLSIGLLTSCVNNDSYSVPEQTLTTYEFTATKTVNEINKLAKTNPVEYTSDDIIEAYVTSSDEKGTFYKSISFQTIPTDGSSPIGFSVPINATTLYGKGFSPGRKVYIKMKGLYSAIVFGSLQIGSLFEGTIGRISEFDWQNHLFPSATLEDENTFVRTLSLADAYKDVNQNTLVELSVVQFAEGSIDRTYYDVDSGGGATNHELISSTGGPQQIIRFSSFCPFTGNKVPSGSGTIRGVLSKYDTDFQFIVRYESDIKLTGKRLSINSPLGGTNIQFNGSLTEDFTSYNVSDKIFPKYVNDQTFGGRYWAMKQFPTGSGNKYIEMSSFGGSGNPGVAAKCFFFVPINFTLANTFTFKKQIRFNNGEVLKVYYVKESDYVASGSIDLNTFTDITSSFNISYPASGSSDSGFSSVGSYTIPTSLTGNGFFVFVYTGTSTVTTTMQIDDITIN